MLAVVDALRIFLRRLQGKRGGPAAQKRSGFVQLDVESDRSQSSRGGQTRQPSADDDYAGNGGAPPVNRSFSAWSTMRTFSKSLSLTRLAYTS